MSVSEGHNKISSTRNKDEDGQWEISVVLPMAANQENNVLLLESFHGSEFHFKLLGCFCQCSLLFQSILNSCWFLSQHICRVHFTSCSISDTTANTFVSLAYTIHIAIQQFEMVHFCMTLLHVLTQYSLKSSYRNFHLVKKCRLYFFYLTKLFPIT